MSTMLGRERQAHITHIPQSLFLSKSTILENIAFGVAKDNIDIFRVNKGGKNCKTIDSWNGNGKYESVV